MKLTGEVLLEVLAITAHSVKVMTESGEIAGTVTAAQALVIATYGSWQGAGGTRRCRYIRPVPQPPTLKITVGHYLLHDPTFLRTCYPGGVIADQRSPRGKKREVEDDN